MYKNWSEKEYVKEEVKKDGFNLQFASKELRANREVVLAAVQNYGWALAYASPELQGDKEIVLLAIKNEKHNTISGIDVSILQYASRELQHDKEVVDAALQSHEKAELWAYPPENEWNDKTFVLKQVKNNGNQLVKASDELKADREVVYAAVEQNPYAMRYVTNKELINDLLKKNPKLFDKVNYSRTQDGYYEVQKAVFSAKEKIYEKNKEIALEKVKENGLELEHLNEEFQNDPDIVLVALKKNIDAFEFIGDKIKDMLPNLLIEKLSAIEVKEPSMLSTIKAKGTSSQKDVGAKPLDKEVER